MVPADVHRGAVHFAWPSLRVRLLLYGALPFVLLGGLAALYYADVPALRAVVSPDLAGLRPDESREFGLLESLQNVLLLAIVVVAAAGLARKRLLGERLALWVVLLGALFMLLEETDYGLQYVALLRGTAAGSLDGSGYHNIHRIGYTQVVMQNVAKFGALTFFGGFAIVFAGSRRPVLRYLAPDRLSVLAILLVTALQEAVWAASQRYPVAYGSLSGDEVEFADLGVYYLVLLYVVDLVFWRRYEPATDRFQGFERSL